MAKTRLAKKRRLARAHAHQEQTRTHAPYDVQETYQRAQRPDPWPDSSNAAYDADSVRVSLAELQAEFNATGEAHILSRPAEPPARAKCRHCSKSQKVKKDGTFGKHDGIRGGECAGVGEAWNLIGHDGGAI